MSIVSSSEARYRYLAAIGGTEGPFAQFLKELDVSLSFSLEKAVALGWIEPVLRVRLPKRFYLNWKSYPMYPREGSVHPQDLWAAQLYGYCTMSVPVSAVAWRDIGTTDGWWDHFLDRPELGLTSSVLRHAVGTRARLPDAFRHPRREEVRPWIDFYAYWQVYELLEIQYATTLFFKRVQNTPDAARTLRAMARRVPQESEFADISLQTVKKQWVVRREVFEWISRYRTLLGILMGPPMLPFEFRNQAALKLGAQLGLTADVLKTAIRDVLLVMWSAWNPPRKPGSTKVHRLLQQDIVRALELWSVLSGKPFDPADPFWGRPADHQARMWTPLPDAVPFEFFDAKEDFPRHASHYLESFNASVSEPQRFTEDRIRDLVAKHWHDSASLRRLCVAFARLHDHYGGDINDDNLVTLREQTPIEFLILSTLHVEKLLAEQHPGVTKFSPLVLAAALRAWRLYGLSAKLNQDRLKTSLYKDTLLHNLPTTRRDPFLKRAHYNTGSSEADCLLRCFANFAVMRNYSAHHDVLDEELVYSPMGRPGIEGVVVTTLLCLETWT